jgi:hypothetical protein
MNCNFCKKHAIPQVVKIGEKIQIFYQCFEHGTLKVQWKNTEVYAISNGVYRIRNIAKGKFFLDSLQPRLKVLMKLESDPKVNPDNFDKKLKTLLVFS